MLEFGAADGWFFIRYGDPEWHVRLRFHGEPQRLRDTVAPAIDSTFASLLYDGRLWRIQYDTYEREIERYGGAEAMLLAEQFFQIDSEIVLEMLEQFETGDAGADARWRVTLLGIDRLLTDLGFELAVKTSVMKKVRTEFAREFKIDSQLKGQLSERFRKDRSSLERLFYGHEDPDDSLAPALEIFQRRSKKMAPVMTKLRELDKAGRLNMPRTGIAPSYVHMFVNRMLRSAQRAHELVLYDFLARLYDSRIARSKA